MSQSLFEQATQVINQERERAAGYGPDELAVFVPQSLGRIAAACGEFAHDACDEIPTIPGKHRFAADLQNAVATPILNFNLAFPVQFRADDGRYRPRRLFVPVENTVFKVQSSVLDDKRVFRVTRF